MNFLTSRSTPHFIRSAITASLAMAGLVACLALSAPSASAAPGLRYQLGYSVQHGWLCDGWRSGEYHCTAHWKVVNGRFVSLHESWVPSQGHANSSRSGSAGKSGGAGHHSPPAPVSHPSYKPSHVPYPFGQCTYGAYLLAHDNVGGLGMARDWYYDAMRRGMPTGSAPRVGATVTFQPGVQGASPWGHVGHVVKIGANGWFLMEAMNDNAGFGRFGFRWVHTGWGVHFIY